MPRVKGSKNKAIVNTAVDTVIDYAAQIAEKNAAADAVAQEIGELGDKIGTLNAERKAKHVELRKLNKEIEKLEAKKVEADKKAAEEAAEKEAIDLVKKALASGTKATDIIDLLK